MNDLTRRALLRTTALFPVAVLAARCSAPAAIPAVVAQAAAIVENFGPALLNAVSSLGSIIPADVLAKVQVWGGDLVFLAGQLAAAPTEAAGASILTTIEGLSNSAISALSAVPGLPSAVASIIGDIKIALPIAESLFSLLSPSPVAARMRAEAPAGKTLAQALAELAQTAGRPHAGARLPATVQRLTARAA